MKIELGKASLNLNKFWINGERARMGMVTINEIINLF